MESLSPDTQDVLNVVLDDARSSASLDKTGKRGFDARIILTTCEDFDRGHANTNWQSDFIKRLQRRSVRIPGLNERKSDIPPLVKFAIQRHERIDRSTNNSVQVCARDWLLLARIDWTGKEARSLLELVRASAETWPRRQLGIDDLEDINDRRAFDDIAEMDDIKVYEEVVAIYGIKKRARLADLLGVNRSTITRLLKNTTILKKGS